MSMHNLKITIITVCFNAAETIERTIRSVCSQSYPEIEYIIIDGASTDKTLEIIKEYPTRVNKLVSEKDNGIYDAMNKGVAIATGDIVYFLNADDRFYDVNVVADIAKVFAEDSSRMLVYGNVTRIGEEQNAIVTLRGKAFISKSRHGFLFFLHSAFFHQAVFARRSLFSTVGMFNCQYKCSADYEWVVKVFKFNPSCFFYLDRTIAYYFSMGYSYQNASITRQEKAGIELRYLFCLESVWYFIRYFLIRGFKKRLLNENW